MSAPAVRLTIVVSLVLNAASLRAQSIDLERPPINYSKTKAENPVEALGDRLVKHETKLARNEKLGYLPAVLESLGIPKSSQCLVYSKTSLQRHVIAPETPRAIYFNDDVYVGYCQDGELLEIATADDKIGAAFYTLYQEAARPKFARQSDRCLNCHGATTTEGVPRHLIRSMKVDDSGYQHLSAGSTRTDTTTPFSKRWGGWYVTGTHGAARHLGNAVFTKEEADDAGPKDASQNVTDLKKLFNTDKYLTPHSDIVAHLVLEHQADMHNRLCRAALTARLALDEQRSLNAELGEKPDHKWDSVARRIENAADDVVEGLVFKEEPPLPAPVKGSSGFAEEFAAKKPRDRSGKSLREFDLKTRVFLRPVSYLIYSSAFRTLPPTVRERALVKLHTLLTTPKLPKEYQSLAASNRAEIVEIIRDTVPDLPACWAKAK